VEYFPVIIFFYVGITSTIPLPINIFHQV
jgi:hypothetical protein